MRFLGKDVVVSVIADINFSSFSSPFTPEMSQQTIIFKQAIYLKN